MIRDLFSFIDEKKKLEIIKYNKSMQNIISINIMDYKFLSQKYIIFEENGQMKEYDKYYNILLFEGMYMNWKKNGKGKEYYEDGKLKFEG